MLFFGKLKKNKIENRVSRYKLMFQHCISRSTPCPNVKHGDEWGDSAQCESGDNCPYCHTRTEQQFHPEVLLILLVI